jgi:nicotinamidase-related amidase
VKDKTLDEQSRAYLAWLYTWKGSLPARAISMVIGDPARTAVMSVDMIVGFCSEGPLASPRVAGIDLFTKAHGEGVRTFLLFQDSHEEGAPEFDSFGPHCVAGSPEAETIPELAGLPFSSLLKVIPKNSLSSAIGTGLDSWLASHEAIDRFIVVGDCTDLCVYQLAMHLRLTANASNIERSVIVPADCVETYDMPVDRARELGVLPHDGELLHAIFLYHMALSGIEIIAGVE